jgi:hypothetical protein
MAQIIHLDAYRPFPPPAAAMALPAAGTFGPNVPHARIFALGVLIGAALTFHVWAFIFWWTA